MAEKKGTKKSAASTATKKKAASGTAETKTVKKKAAKKKTTRRTTKKAAENVRLKAFWGVFNHALKRVALYDYSQKKQAETKAKELTASAKTPHFVQKVKEPVADG